MRITLIYLLTFCILFFNGMKSGIAEMNHRFNAFHSVKISFEKDNSFCGTGDITNNEPVSVLTEDDDDDESSTIKKKKAEQSTLQLKTNIPVSLSGSVLANRFYKHFSYLSSHRYILHRVIII